MNANFQPPNPAANAQGANQPQQSNWPFLVIAILMAVVLWLFVRTGAHPEATRVLEVAVATTNATTTDLTVSPERIEVRLEGNRTALERLQAEEVAVIADLSRHHEGDLVPLTVVPPQGIKVLGTSVSQIRVVKLPPTPR